MSKSEHRNEELDQETNRLKVVESKIGEQLAHIQRILGERKRDSEEIRRNFWDNVTVNLTNETEQIETFTSIQQEARVLAEQERSEREAERQYATLQRLANSPYFGRVDFRADADQHVEKVYIGLASLVDSDGETFWIYDWREPISSLFYDHTPGRAEYAIPDGNVSGEMMLKRQFVIKDGQLQHMFDTDVTIGDSLLQQALSQSANAQMKSIVATIQREQNQIIRDERHRLLIVQGAAGSGKTSAALQRVAYLLYRYRGSLTADQIVLFSPNPLFNSYISNVLPELGETNMRQSTFQEYLQRKLRVFKLDIENLYEQTEYVLAKRANADHAVRIEAIRYKASSAFFSLMNAYVAHLDTSGMVFRDIRFRGRVLLSRKELADLFYGEQLAKYRLQERIEQWKKLVLLRLHELEKEERRKKWVSDAIDLLDDESYRIAYEKLRESGSFKGDTFDDERKERALLRKMVVNEQFVPIRKRLKRGFYIDYMAIYRRLIQDETLIRKLTDGTAELPSHMSQFDALFQTAIQEGKLPYEDATPLLYLKESIDGFSDHDNSVRHVLVDEAQDYSPFQYAVLRQLFPRARLTLLGDLNQAIYLQTAGLSGLPDVAEAFGIREQEAVSVITLLRSYRSTQQIVELSKRLLSSAANVQPFSRDGELPRLLDVAHDGQAVKEAVQWINDCRQRGHANIGILTYTAREARDVQQLLLAQQVDDMHLISTETTELERGVSVIPAYLAKGIEFDAVLIWNASHYQEEDRKLLYTAFTRAMHDLFVMYRDGEPGLLEPLLTSDLVRKDGE